MTFSAIIAAANSLTSPGAFAIAVVALAIAAVLIVFVIWVLS